METSQSLVVESFSYSWLSNVKLPLDGLDEPYRTSIDSSNEAPLRELDNGTVKSKRFLTETQNFNFDIPIPQSPVTLFHADELFSNGLIRPVFVDPSKAQASNALNSIQTMSGSSISARTVVPAVRINCRFLGRWRKSSERILRKCFQYLRPFFREVGCSRNNTRVDIDRRASQVKSWSSSSHASPQRSTSYSVGDWCYLESLIDEAVLHCKRSIEK